MPKSDTNQNDSEIIERDEKALSEIYHVLAGMHDEVFIKYFFGCLFTPVELHDVAKRWLLVKEIDRGTPQREIARMFNMSLCKITRGSRELKKKDSAFRKVLDTVSKEQEK